MSGSKSAKQAARKKLGLGLRGRIPAAKREEFNKAVAEYGNTVKHVSDQLTKKEPAQVKENKPRTIEEKTEDVTRRYNQLMEELFDLQREGAQLPEELLDALNWESKGDRQTKVEQETKQESKAKEEKEDYVINKKEFTPKMKNVWQDIVSRKHLSRTVAIPDLYREMKKEYPDLGLENFKNYISELVEDYEIDLPPVNEITTDLIEDDKFVIEMPLGKGYYVSWR